MKNKTKLNKIKAQSTAAKPTQKLPDAWLLLSDHEATVADIDAALSDSFSVEIWPDAGVAEVEIAEKAFLDLETLEPDLGDDYSNAFLAGHNTRSLFYITFRKEDYDAAKKALALLADQEGFFVCGDSEDFMPQF